MTSLWYHAASLLFLLRLSVGPTTSLFTILITSYNSDPCRRTVSKISSFLEGNCKLILPDPEMNLHLTHLVADGSIYLKFRQATRVPFHWTGYLVVPSNYHPSIISLQASPFSYMIIYLPSELKYVCIPS